MSQAVAKNMIDAGIQGSIVNVSSTISEVRLTVFIDNFVVGKIKKKKKIITTESTVKINLLMGFKDCDINEI